MSTHGNEAQDATASRRLAELEAELARAHARLREVDHRMKNDLQLIASVFVLQARRAPAGPERDAAQSALDRINALMAVHRRFEPNGETARMAVDGLVRDIAEEALAACRREDVGLRLEIDPVTVPTRQAAPLALITGELVREALTQPVAGGPGAVTVSLKRGSDEVELSVEGNGDGRDGEAAKGFGATLVGLLAQQLRGRFETLPAEPGRRAVVRFPQSA